MADAVAPHLALHHRLLAQRRQKRGHFITVHVRGVAHGLGRVQPEAAGEDGQPSPYRLLTLGKQLFAPFDGGPQGPLPAWYGDPAHEQVEASIQTLQHPIQRQRSDHRRAQLERERDPVQAPAELDHRRGVRLVKSEPGVTRLQTLHQQLDRFASPQPVRVAAMPVLGHGQRRNPQDQLPLHAKGLAAADQYSKARAQPKQGPDQPAAGY